MSTELDKIFELAEASKFEPKTQSELDKIFSRVEASDPLSSSGAGAVTKDDTYLSRIGGLVEKRGQEVAETMEAMQEDEINYGEFALQTVGKGFFGTVMDIAGETVATVLSELTPDAAENQIKEWIASGAKEVLDTKAAQELLTLYQDLDPNTRKNIESATNIAFGWSGLAAGKSAMTKPIKLVKDSATKSRLNKMKNKLSSTVLSQKSKAKEARGSQKWTEFENEMLNEVALLKGITPNKPSKNIEIIDKELRKLDSKITKDLRSSPKAFKINVTQDTLRKRIEADIDALKTGEHGVVYTDESLKSVYDRLDNMLYNEKSGYAKNSTFKPIDLHRLRQNLDTGIKALSKGTDKPIIEAGAQGKVIRTYRNSINKLLDDLDTGVDTSVIRSKKHKLIEAKKNLSANKDKVKTKFETAVDYAKKHPWAVAAGLSGSGILHNSKVLGAGMLGASVYAPYKAATAPATRELLAKTLPMAGMVVSPKTAPVSGMFYGKQEDEDIAP